MNGDNYVVKCLVIYPYHVLLGDKMKESDMVVACKEVELRKAHKKQVGNLEGCRSLEIHRVR